MHWIWFQRLRALEVCDAFAACGGGAGGKVSLTPFRPRTDRPGAFFSPPARGFLPGGLYGGGIFL